MATLSFFCPLLLLLPADRPTSCRYVESRCLPRQQRRLDGQPYMLPCPERVGAKLIITRTVILTNSADLRFLVEATCVSRIQYKEIKVRPPLFIYEVFCLLLFSESSPSLLYWTCKIIIIIVPASALILSRMNYLLRFLINLKDGRQDRATESYPYLVISSDAVVQMCTGWWEHAL